MTYVFHVCECVFVCVLRVAGALVVCGAVGIWAAAATGVDACTYLRFALYAPT